MVASRTVIGPIGRDGRTCDTLYTVCGVNCATPVPRIAHHVKVTAWICRLKSTSPCSKTIALAAIATKHGVLRCLVDTTAEKQHQIRYPMLTKSNIDAGNPNP